MKNTLIQNPISKRFTVNVHCVFTSKALSVISWCLAPPVSMLGHVVYVQAAVAKKAMTVHPALPPFPLLITVPLLLY
eukprot:1110400-Pyramimonas_sp.AAC.2